MEQLQCFFDAYSHWAEGESIFTTYEQMWSCASYFLIVVGILYIPAWRGLQAAMRGADLTAWNLRYLKALHNLIMCVYSTIGGVYVLIMFFDTYSGSFTESACVDSWSRHRYANHILIFCFSKLFELPETFYMVLERKPVAFLHWYHHIVTYTFCCITLLFDNPGSIWFALMNLWVHAVMYFYYTLVTITGGRYSWAIIITIMQIAQMFVGFAVTVIYTFQCPRVGEWSQVVAWYGMVMYGSYIYLFMDFFVKRYIFKRPKRPSTKKSQ
mmetsp:Transcript_1838/g.6564  ORF Transcript_1838/g.6564 Transcript_1838/m.6564 type:complete len:269 (+) Transcript_1838:84-890(+)